MSGVGSLDAESVGTPLDDIGNGVDGGLAAR